jgi:hypothetical protein
VTTVADEATARLHMAPVLSAVTIRGCLAFVASPCIALPVTDHHDPPNRDRHSRSPHLPPQGDEYVYTVAESYRYPQSAKHTSKLTHLAYTTRDAVDYSHRQ